MFSGIIESKYRIYKGRKYQIFLRMKTSSDKLGDSIAVNGVCLTLVKKLKINKEVQLYFDLSPETLKKTTFPSIASGSLVNIERALKMRDALGGHIVQGHVDGVGQVVKIIPLGDNKEIWFKAPPSVLKYLVSKGSITIDGVSLTVVQVRKNQFSVALIPFTLANTNLGAIKKGDNVNLEADIMAKYVEKYSKR